MSSNNPFSYYAKAWNNYVNFSGRAARKEYWLFVLANVIVAFAIAFVGSILVGATKSQGILALYDLILFLPSLAYVVRRLHDSDHSGWWLLLPIVNIVLLCFPGTEGANRFGPALEK